MKIDETITIQNPHLVMLPIVHLKDEVEPTKVPQTDKFFRWCNTNSYAQYSGKYFVVYWLSGTSIF